VGVTGNSVFVTEFGSRLLRDVLLAAAGTLIVIALLFWWAHRRWAPLLWLVTLLMVTVALTAAIGGFLFGTLNAVSLGFAAMLMGLAVDYGLILYQEWRTHPERSASDLRRVMAPGILWAAVTTAGAFALVSRSSLPGLTQLGFLIVIGITTAAILMLMVYVALIGRPVARRNSEQKLRQQEFSHRTVLTGNRHLVWLTTLFVLFLSVIVLINQRPGVDDGITALQFEDVQARTILEEIQREITGSGSDLWLIIRGADEREVGSRLDKAEAVLARAEQNGVLTRKALPTGLWPQVDSQQGNREAMRALVTRLPTVQEAAIVAGFTPDSLELTKAMFEVWQQFADLDTVAWPKQPASRWLFNQFSASDSEQMLALGQLEVASTVSNDRLFALASELAAMDGGQLVGWPLLTGSLMETMKNDVTRVVLPMALALVVLLGFAYRDVREIALSFATLGFTMICLFAAMSVLNWSWNLMNMTALPLLLGAGVDYSIHIQLALKRYAGSIAHVKRSVGNAILLCGASTAAAFASLGFASNPGLASLGQVAALGIIIASLTAVFLLPVWWSAAQGRNKLKEVGKE
jgi:predicted exporter